LITKSRGFTDEGLLSPIRDKVT
jgi:hypothetical protein